MKKQAGTKKAEVNNAINANLKIASQVIIL
jgi:hypothetical protein